jgi:cysteine-rich repeat protein
MRLAHLRRNFSKVFLPIFVLSIFVVLPPLTASAAAPLCNGQTADIYVEAGFIVGGPDDGLAYADILNGTSGADVMVGTSGADTINGNQNGDTICAGDGDDTVNGGNGTDTIFGEDGNDVLRGGNGTDTVNGGNGQDFCNGNNGPTILQCEANDFEGVLIIKKDSVPDHSQNFAFTSVTTALNFSLDDDGNGVLQNIMTLTLSGAVAPGGTNYTVTESAVAGWNVTSIVCDDTGDASTTTNLGARSATINLDEANIVTCTFTNTAVNSDGDSFIDNDDNCDLISNPGQEDSDNDGIGDDCDPETCGNNDVEGTEACDDGNLAALDGCSATCTVETGYSCTGDPSVCTPIPEVCNGVDDDGDSQVDEGFPNTDGDLEADCVDADDDNDGDLDGPDNCDLVANPNQEDGDNDGIGDACDPPACGNNFIELGETCDDGNTLSGDGCTALCADEFCGDGIDNDGANEQCDDGNGIDTDACTNSCTAPVCGDSITSPPETCDEGGLNGTPNHCNATCDGTTIPVCPNNVIEAGEQCDDGNIVLGDGCDATCQVTVECSDGVDNADAEDALSDQFDPGCYDNGNVSTGVYQPLDNDETHSVSCGNGAPDQISEECDDGNVNNNDGCTNACQLPECGDSIVTAPETCDDGNTNPNDGCSASCTVEAGYECTPAEPSVCTVDCGDGIVTSPETCDDGGLNGNPNQCNLTCSGTTTTICGNNAIEAGETCDDGGIATGDGCDASCQIEVANACPVGAMLGHWPLEEGSGTNTVDLTLGNDGTLENGTLWTGAGAPLAGGTNSLTFDGVDDVVRAANSGDFALGNSEFTVSLFARTLTGNRSVMGNYDGDGWGLYFYSDGRVNFFGYGTGGINDNAFLGNNVVDGQWHHVAGVYKRSGAALTIETYVDGTLVGTNTANVGDITSGSDLLFGRYLLQPHFAGSLDEIRIYDRALTGAEVSDLATGCSNLCGNNVVNSPETCDDGDSINDDECTNACTLPVCGDSIVQAGEQCDDGGTANGDGCDEFCQTEVVLPFCGDGNVDGGEQCDTAGQSATCEANCTLPICGDNILNLAAGEQCDDGNTANGDGCSSTCQSTFQCNDTVDNVDAEDVFIDAADPGCYDNGNVLTGLYTPTDNDETHVPACGNGALEGIEECDDGNVASSDGCSATCTIEPTDTDGDGQTDADEIACGSDPNDNASLSTDTDGDNIPDCVDPDDDNDSVLDGPDNCELVANPGQEDLDNDGTGDACDPQTCGNADIEGTETCDDGDQLGGDGCSAVCAVEVGWSCVHEPSVCVIAPICDGQTATIFVSNAPGSPTIYGGLSSGSPYTGTLNGTGGNDVMVGTSGKDTINASNGNDIVCAGGNDDTLNGSNGDDKMFGEGGNDKLYGSNNNDRLDGGPGNDILDGSNGLDFIIGRAGNDTLIGSNDADVMCGGTDNDALQGDIANDRMDGGGGTDTMKGGLGSDVCANGETLSSCENTAAVVECSGL